MSSVAHGWLLTMKWGVGRHKVLAVKIEHDQWVLHLKGIGILGMEVCPMKSGHFIFSFNVAYWILFPYWWERPRPIYCLQIGPCNSNSWNILFTASPVTLGIHMKAMTWCGKQCEGALLCNDFTTWEAEHICVLVIHWFSALFIVFTRTLHLYSGVRGFLFPLLIAFFQTRNWAVFFFFYFTNFAVCIEF